MTRAPLAVLSLLFALGACTGVSESRLNPFNWFSGAESEDIAAGPQEGIAQDPRPLVARVTDMQLEPVRGGAILRATGETPTQGWWNAALVPQAPGGAVDGVLSLRFVAVPPPRPTPVSTPQSREITLAVRLSDAELRNVRELRVQGAENRQSVRR